MIAAAVAISIALAAGAPTPPAPSRWVEDGVGLLSSAGRVALDRRLEAYQRATGHQVVVWIGASLDGGALDEWSSRTFAAWKVGRKDADDGAAIFVFATDRTIAIEVGYGLEGDVPDAVASRIIREVMAPGLVASDADGAVTAGVDALLAAIEGRPWSGATTPAPPEAATSMSPLEIVLAVLAAIAFLVLLATHPRLALVLLWSIMSRGRGGGGGGFSGGGGRAGGGGARGGW